MSGCKQASKAPSVEVIQSSREGGMFKANPAVSPSKSDLVIRVDVDNPGETILGFGGAFTESSAYLWSQMSETKQKELIAAYFADTGASYSLTRTHINSCDFSLSNYAYDTVPDDTDLEHFSIERDEKYLIPMIQAASKQSSKGFKIVASPWTAPPWMKDNNSWKGGKLLPKYYDTWAKYFEKYLNAYEQRGINIWGITVENEPLGNGENWESMHFTADEMANFLGTHLGPKLKSLPDPPQVFVFDQNRDEELITWSERLLLDSGLNQFIDGTAVHWYSSTVDANTDKLDMVKKMAPEKSIIHSEGCIDAERPVWKNDNWYWSREATDWGYDWAPEHQKADHPKYVPVYRYANDIIECMNHHVSGWIDWNMILDKEGGPNWAKNWCIAPVIVDPSGDEIYYTPLYYVMKHFSKFIDAGSQKLNIEMDSDDIKCTASLNSNGQIVLVILNMKEESKNVSIQVSGENISLELDRASINTVLIEA